MKQVNFTHSGGFPLEQETLERLQTAYRSELFGAFKSHLGINPDNNYIVAQATNEKEGWAIIRQEGEGILYPIQPATSTQFLKTTRTGTNLTYGTGESQIAYFDYEAQYISATDYANRPASPITDALAIHYYDLNNPAFIVIKDIQTIEAIIKSIEANINSIKTNIAAIETNIDAVEADISSNYLPLKGSKAMEGDLNLGDYQLSKLDIKETPTANVRVKDFRLGSNLGKALVNDSTKLTLNSGPDWQNTSIGGKLYLENLNTSDSNNSLLIIDDSNQVTKNNTLINSLINRIAKLESQPVTAVPIGMIAIWGKPAPFPEGWEEYVPLRGRMPVGLDSNDSAFSKLLGFGGSKEKTLTKENIPQLDLKIPVSSNDNSGGTFKYVNATDVDYATDKEYTGVVNKGNITTAINILNPYRVVQFIEYTGNITPPGDTIAPTSPTNLTASKIGTKSLTLSWNASTDNVGVTNYLVYKDNSNTPLAELGKDVLIYNVTGLSANTPYSFQVRAKDAAGNLSVPATVSTATIAADSTPPTLPSYLHCVHNGQGYIQVEWGTSQDDDSPIDYEISRSAFGSLFTVLKKDTNTFYSEKVISNGTYTYRVRAIDPSGNASAYKEASITISSL